MDYKKILNISFLVSVVFFVAGYFLVYFPGKIFFCEESESFCIFSLGEPLLFGFGQLAIIFLILRFLPKQVFTAWLWFAVWYIPLAAIWVFSTPSYGGAFLSPGKEGIVWILGGIYMTVSILIIIIRLLFLKLKKRK